MNATAVVARPRLHWVDVMKVLGMFFIIYGHLFTYGYQYAYAFNVPVFFVLSGFLFKEDQSASEFWRKLWWQLAVPMLAICVLNNTYLIINDLLHHRLDTPRFLDVCWFIYTLILLKIISFFVRIAVLPLLRGRTSGQGGWLRGETAALVGVYRRNGAALFRVQTARLPGRLDQDAGRGIRRNVGLPSLPDCFLSPFHRQESGGHPCGFGDFAYLYPCDPFLHQIYTLAGRKPEINLCSIF